MIRALLLTTLLVGCSVPLRTSVDTFDVPVAISTACIEPADIPPLPASRMPLPGSNVARLAAGASADDRALYLYATQLHAMLVACAKEPK